MAKSSSLTLILVAAGGVAVGLLAAQAAPSFTSTASAAESTNAQQGQVSQALAGLENITLGERARGEITSAAELNGNDGSRYLRYVISLEEDSLVEVSLSGALKGVLALYDDQLQLLESAETVRHHVEESGDYVVIVSGEDARSYGPFTLNSRTVELSESDTLAIGEPMDSWLGGRSREVSLTVEEAGMYQIEMRADEFDAYLELSGPNGYYREDDDGAGNLNARISDFLAPGEYTVTARSAFGEGSGLFTLSAEPRELPGDGELRNNGSVMPSDTLSGWYSGEPLTYELTLEESSLVRLSMRSSDFDTYLELNGGGDSYSDDDGGSGTNSRLEQALLPGTYTVIARGFAVSGSGMFELQVNAEPTEMQPDA